MGENVKREDWDVRVEQIVRGSKRRGTWYLLLGLAVYGGGSAVIIASLWNNPTIATACVMFLFQLCVMYFGTKVMYPRFDGVFLLSIEANRDAVPAFEKFERKMADIEEADFKAFIREGRAAFAELKNAASGTKLDELTLRFERKMDQAIDAFSPEELSEEEARAAAGKRIGKI